MEINYANNLKTAIALNPTFEAICDFNIQNYPVDGYSKFHKELENGKAILKKTELLNSYMAAYGDMHQYKLDFAFTSLFELEDFNKQSIEIVDWGCGQAIASCVLIDFVKKNNLKIDLSKFTLIEPSYVALQRGLEHIDAICQRKPKPILYAINEMADKSLQIKNFQQSKKIKIHLFSNLLDIQTLDLNQVFENITQNFDGLNYFVCVSPTNGYRLQTFYKMFKDAKLLSSKGDPFIANIFRPSEMRKINKQIYRVEYIFKTIL